MVVAEVTTTPIKENKVIEAGSAMACPFICARWLLAYLVKSGIFKESVAQKPTIPVSAGKKKVKKSLLVLNLDGCSKIGPKPLPALMAQNNKASAANGRKNALNTSSFF